MTWQERLVQYQEDAERQVSESKRLHGEILDVVKLIRADLEACEGGNPVYEFPLLSQRDLRWSGHTLGTGKTTIGQYGCVITSLAMALSHERGHLVTPLDVNAGLLANGGYVGANGNLVIWDKVSRAFPGFDFKGVVIAKSVPAPVDDIDKWLAAGEYVIAQVDYNVVTTPVDEHWVLIVGGDKEAYTIHDPWIVPESQTPLVIPPAYCNKAWTKERGFKGYTSRAIFRLVRYAKGD